MPFACALNWTESPRAQKLKPRHKLVHQDLVEVLETGGWEDSKYVAEKCYELQSKNGSYLSTAFVVRDMVRIIDALGEDGKLRFWGIDYKNLRC